MKSILKIFCKEMWFVPSDVLQRSVEAKIWSGYFLKKPILEIGTGDGRTSKLLFGSVRIDVGIDNNKEAVLRGKECDLYKKLIVADARKLPFDKHTFSSVVSNSTLEHINNNGKVISEVSRVLKQHGTFYFCVPLAKLARYIESKYGKKGLTFVNKRLNHLDYRDTSDWVKLLKINGLEVSKKIFYLGEDSVDVWYRYLRILTAKFKGKEMWSHLAHSRFSSLLPKTLFSRLVYSVLVKHYKNSITPDGYFIFLKAVKKK